MGASASPAEAAIAGVKAHLTLYRNERSPAPIKSGSIAWSGLCSFLSKRDLRPGKSGLAFSLHRLKPDCTRSNDAVADITGLVGDIDRGADIEAVRQMAAPLRAIIYSTHGHAPSEDRIKLRVIVALTRPVTPEEYPDIFAGFNAMLGGVLDPACKDPARLYFAPSCPADRFVDAFFETFDGEPIDPDTLKAPRPLASPALPPIDNSDLVSTAPPPAESPQEIQRVRSMLDALPPDASYGEWRDIVWAVRATGWTCAYSLAMEWSQRGAKFEQAAFDKCWASYDVDRANGIGFSTLPFLARKAGWAESAVQLETASGATGDVLNGELFARMWRGKLLRVHETGEGLLFDPASGWVHAPPGEADRAAKQVVAKLREYAAEKWKAAPDDPRTKRLMAHVERSSTEPKLRAMIALAGSEPGMTKRLAEMDADPQMIGVGNGVLDLRASHLLPASPDLLVTKRCAVDFDPEAAAPTWERFVERITQGKPAVAAFLQRLAGYLLTGEVGEQCFAFLYGLGANGKTTFAETLRWLMGDYAVILPASALMTGRRDPGAASPDLMLLKGARLALATETEESSRLAEAQLKQLTGGDAITARNPYGLFTTWMPTHKILIVGNHKPIIAGGDLGVWRRVRLVPFEETIPENERDPRLIDKLRAEGPGILNWAVAGFHQRRRQGLNPPPEVRAAGDAYRADMDIVGQWLEEHTEPAVGEKTATASLYKGYRVWARDAGLNPMSRNTFGRRLVERGVVLVKSSGTIHAKGLRLNTAGHSAAARAF